MAKFIVTETKTVQQIWTYEVEAEDQNEALMKVFDEEVEADDYRIVNMEEDSEFEVEEIY